MDFMSSTPTLVSVSVAGRFRMRKYNSLTRAWSSLFSCTIFTRAFFGSLRAALTVGPVTNAITGPNCMPPARSHSHGLSRGGRPNVVRKPLPSLMPESGNCAARVPGGTPGSFDCVPVT